MRRADGSLELADFILPPQKRQKSPRRRRRRTGANRRPDSRARTVTLIDEPSKTRLHLLNVEGDGTCEGKRIVVDNLRGILNGGPFQFSGQLDRTGDEPTLEARFRAEKVVLDDGMRLLRYAVPVLAGASLNLKGNLDTDLYLQGKGKTWNR